MSDHRDEQNYVASSCGEGGKLNMQYSMMLPLDQMEEIKTNK